MENEAPVRSRVAEPGPEDRQWHDDSLILWMLELSVSERITAAQKIIDDVTAFRAGVIRHDSRG